MIGFYRRVIDIETPIDEVEDVAGGLHPDPRRGGGALMVIEILERDDRPLLHDRSV
jgi:hypothetical protein